MSTRVPLLSCQPRTLAVVEVTSLKWPTSLQIPSKLFRLFVAADVTAVADDVIAEFAHAALRSGMVYLCAWGPGCERLHDMADQVIVQDDQGDRLFAGPNQQDTIMTTWHDGETLNEALAFFVMNSYPTDGFEAGSNYWLAISVGNPHWAATIKQKLEESLR